MSDFDKDKNCHSYCRYGRVCKYAKGEKGRDPEDCGTYYKLEDIEIEAREIAMEEKRARYEVGEDW